MPDREKPDARKAPAERGRQRVTLLRVAAVVGLPLLAVALRLPIWFTLLLMFGLAAFLFFSPRLPARHDPDPKKAWSQLMACFVQLQTAYDALRRLPSDTVVRKRFVTIERACVSLLNSRPQSAWGQDAEYAAKVRNEVAALSASARAEFGILDPLPGPAAETPGEAGIPESLSGEEGLASQPGGPAPSVVTEATTTATMAVSGEHGKAETTGDDGREAELAVETERRDAAGRAVATADAGFEVPDPAEPKPASAGGEATAASPDVPVPSVRPEVLKAENVGTALRLYSHALPAGAKGESITETWRRDATGAAPGAEAEVLMSPKPQVPTTAGGGTAPQPDTSAVPPASPYFATPGPEQTLTSTGGNGVPPPGGTSPSVEPEVLAPAEELGLMPSYRAGDGQPSGSASAGAGAESGTTTERQEEVVGDETARVASDSRKEAEFTTETDEDEAAREAAVTPGVKTEPPINAELQVTAVPQPHAPASPAASEPAPQQLLPATDDAATKQAVSPAPAGKVDGASPAARRLIPLVWIPGGVEDAAAFYVSVFKNSRITGVGRYPEGSHSRVWSVMSATVCLDGQDLMLLNGGSVYKLPEPCSLQVRCADQAEVDCLWERLLADGGEESAGGWLKDRFGVSWQVIPDVLMELLSDPDPQRVARVTEALFKMKRIDVATLLAAGGK